MAGFARQVKSKRKIQKRKKRPEGPHIENSYFLFEKRK